MKLVSAVEKTLGTKNLKKILKGLKSNVGIFRETIYLFNPILYVFNYFIRSLL